MSLFTISAYVTFILSTNVSKRVKSVGGKYTITKYAYYEIVAT